MWSRTLSEDTPIDALGGAAHQRPITALRLSLSYVLIARLGQCPCCGRLSTKLLLRHSKIEDTNALDRAKFSSLLIESLLDVHCMTPNATTFAGDIPKGPLRACVPEALHLHPCDMLVVHQDADRARFVERIQKIQAASARRRKGRCRLRHSSMDYRSLAAG